MPGAAVPIPRYVLQSSFESTPFDVVASAEDVRRCGMSERCWAVDSVFGRCTSNVDGHLFVGVHAYEKLPKETAAVTNAAPWCQCKGPSSSYDPYAHRVRDHDDCGGRATERCGGCYECQAMQFWHYRDSADE